MKATRRVLLVALLPLFVSQAQVTLATVVLSETEFSSVQSTVLSSTPGASLVGYQSAAGGNPGAYFRSDGTTSVDEPMYLQTNLNIIDGLSFDPSVQGAIDTIEFKWDQRWFNTVGDPGFVIRMAIVQDGTAYRVSGVFSRRDTGWLDEVTMPFVPSYFTPISGPGSTPDFTSSGGRIDFGFVTDFGAPWSSGTGSQSFGLDNYIATLTLVETPIIPEPSTLLVWSLLAALAIGSAAYRRKR